MSRRALLAGAWLAATAAAAPVAAEQTAVFAGGCFWCTESDFEKVPGVLSAVSGYTGGTDASPTYDSVSAGTTGHAEAVEVRFDESKVSYAELLEIFWHSIDPTVADRQFCDEGSQYRSAIFWRGAEQKRQAEASLHRVRQQLKVPIQTQLAEAGRFYPAEEYHQDYYKKNPLRYKFYRNGCGRDRRLEQVWGKQPRP